MTADFRREKRDREPSLSPSPVSAYSRPRGMENNAGSMISER